MDSSKSCSDMSFSSSTQNDPLKLLSRSVKQKKHVFVGNYLEKQYVKALGAYRAIIVVEAEEVDTIQSLREIESTALQQYGANKWLGIACNMADSKIEHYKLWVEIDGITLGKHWFQLRSLKIDNQAIQVTLKYLRKFETHERGSFIVADYPQFDCRELFTYENMCGTARFSAVFVLSVFTVIMNVLWYLGDYSIKLTHELSGLVTAFTPIFFGITDLIARCVGGFYWLIYTMWRGDSVPRHVIRPAIAAPNRELTNYQRQTDKRRQFFS